MDWFSILKLKGRDRPLREMQEQHEQEQEQERKDRAKYIIKIRFHVGEIYGGLGGYWSEDVTSLFSDMFGDISYYNDEVNAGEERANQNNLDYLISEYVELHSKKDESGYLVGYIPMGSISENDNIERIRRNKNDQMVSDNKRKIYKDYIKKTLPKLGHKQVKYVLENQNTMDIRYIKSLSEALENWWVPMYDEVIKKNKRKKWEKWSDEKEQWESSPYYETEEYKELKTVHQKMSVKPVISDVERKPDW